MYTKMNLWLVKVGHMWVSGCKPDTYGNGQLYAKLNPRVTYARIFDKEEEALDVAIDLDGTVIKLSEVEREENH